MSVVLNCTFWSGAVFKQSVGARVELWNSCCVAGSATSVRSCVAVSQRLTAQSGNGSSRLSSFARLSLEEVYVADKSL